MVQKEDIMELKNAVQLTFGERLALRIELL